jgi:hypothetical protein
VPEYQMTAALWMRGLMADEYGVRAEDVHWRTGALDAGVRRERLALALPEGMVVEPIAEGETLQDLLLAGEIDALLAPNPPKAFLAGDARIVRLFADVEAAERDYHARTGFFPLMHLIAVRKTIVDEASVAAAGAHGGVHGGAGCRDGAAARRLARLGQPAVSALARAVHGADAGGAGRGLLALRVRAQQGGA